MNVQICSEHLLLRTRNLKYKMNLQGSVQSLISIIITMGNKKTRNFFGFKIAEDYEWTGDRVGQKQLPLSKTYSKTTLLYYLVFG